MYFPTFLGPIKDTKRTKIRLDRNVAPCSKRTTNVIGPLHECKKVCPCTKALLISGMNQARSEEEEKERKRDKRHMERKAAQQNKNTSEELKQGPPSHS